MKQIISKNQFVKAFDDAGRGNDFSIQGREALFDFFEELESDTGEEIELDVVAICCEFSEYTVEGLNKDYCHLDYVQAIKDDNASDYMLTLEEWSECLQNYTQIIEVDNDYSLIVEDF